MCITFAPTPNDASVSSRTCARLASSIFCSCGGSKIAATSGSTYGARRSGASSYSPLITGSAAEPPVLDLPFDVAGSVVGRFVGDVILVVVRVEIVVAVEVVLVLGVAAVVVVELSLGRVPEVLVVVEFLVLAVVEPHRFALGGDGRRNGRRRPAAAAGERREMERFAQRARSGRSAQRGQPRGTPADHALEADARDRDRHRQHADRHDDPNPHVAQQRSQRAVERAAQRVPRRDPTRRARCRARRSTRTRRRPASRSSWAR